MKKLIMLLAAVLVLVSISSFACAESEDPLIRCNEVDGGKWVDIYEQFIARRGEEYYAASLVDLDLDGKPELVGVKSSAHIGLYTDIVKYSEATDSYTVNDEDIVFGMQSKWSLYELDGTYCWYENEDYAGQGTIFETIRKIQFYPGCTVEKIEWLQEVSTENYEKMETATEEADMFDYTFYVYGEQVDYETYQKENMLRRRMTPIYTFNPERFSYPDQWEEACSEYAVLNK